MKTLLITTIIACISIVDTLNAQITNPKISIQGILREASGVAVEDGEYDLVFRIYTDINDPISAKIYEEEHAGVTVANGIYSVHLGEDVSMGGLNFDEVYYVGVQVGSSELQPRIELTHSPYSMAARSVSCSGAVGDIKYSILDWDDFQDVNGDCWIQMNGQSVPNTTALSQMFGITEVPDMSGLFIRAHEWNDGNDPDRTPSSPIATIQNDELKSHNHGKGTLVTDNQTVSVDDRTLSSISRIDTKCSAQSDCSFSGTLSWNSSSSPSFKVAVDSESDEEAFSVTGITKTSTDVHSHDINGDTADSGGNETRSKNMNFYIYIRIN